MTDSEYDVVVVGGGAAGLSGALALARARRRVLVVDAGSPRNAPADGVHNYLGREGTPPAELLAAGRAEVAGYGGEVVAGTVTGAERDGDGFRVRLATDGGGGTVRARRLLVTTGLVDELPGVPGLAERWARTVLHCPYCHGWEVRDQPIGVLATGPMAVHQALLWTQWTGDVVYFGPEPAADDRERLAVRGVRFATGEVAAVEGEADVRLVDGSLIPRRALVVTPRFTARSEVLESLGLRPVEHELGIGTRIPADPSGATAVPGVWVAGNVADPMGQVIAAATAGLTAGARINAELIEADTAELLARAGSAAAAG
jgi:thioredoxin reductase (NADPH)